jgi:hypothetical protein
MAHLFPEGPIRDIPPQTSPTVPMAKATMDLSPGAQVLFLTVACSGDPRVDVLRADHRNIEIDEHT